MAKGIPNGVKKLCEHEFLCSSWHISSDAKGGNEKMQNSKEEQTSLFMHEATFKES